MLSYCPSPSQSILAITHPSEQVTTSCHVPTKPMLEGSSCFTPEEPHAPTCWEQRRIARSHCFVNLRLLLRDAPLRCYCGGVLWVGFSKSRRCEAHAMRFGSKPRTAQQRRYRSRDCAEALTALKQEHALFALL